ncbi:MAG: ParB N-terminal domain-containing protein [Sphingobium sp.]|nr:ParB N-terminal domain-containing protein [Sphingobium sp.]
MSGVAKMQPQAGRRPSLEFRPLGDLLIDDSYQRSIDSGPSQSLVKRIARAWDWGLCQPLNVAKRDDGALYVIDGQHRLAAARLRGDIFDLPCVVVASRSADDEAAAFVALNQQRRPLSKLELFKAALAAGETEATVIHGALTQAGLSVATTTNPESWKPGQVSNIGGLEYCVRQHGEKILRTSLLAASVAFHGQVLRYFGTIFPGIASGVSVHGVAQGDLIGMVLGSCDQSEWRDAINRAKAEQPNLNMREAAVLAIGRAIAEAMGGEEQRHG